jgi:large subunit ribosomal protein L15
MIRKSKKCGKYRGRRLHGWGVKSRHRGSGNRGGVGNAGSGKRADCKKPSHNPMEYFGRHGFVSIHKGKYNVINVGQINDNFESFKSKEKDGVIDLEMLGYHKLLSAGKVDKKFSIRVLDASASAIEKIKKAGGKVEVFKPSKADEESEEAEAESGDESE